ncbi:MAG: hypothetical protein AB1730_25940 [Myxococcota bacterium]
MRGRPLVALLALAVAGLVAWWLRADETAVASTDPPPPATIAPGASAPTRRPGPARALPPDDEPPAPPSLGARPDLPGAGGGAPKPESLDASIVDAVDMEIVQAWLRTNAAAAEKHVDAFCDQARRVAKLINFEPRTRHRDAAVYMAGRADWEDHRYGLLHLPDSLTARMKDPPLAWRRFGPSDYAGLDFSWMQEIAQFDHWSLSAQGPLSNVDTIDHFTAPLPNYVTMQNWVRLRLVKARDEGDLSQASLEIHHLGDLIASSGTLIGEMIRAAFFNIERGFYEDAGLQPPMALPSADEVQQLRGVAFAGMYFLFPVVKRAVREKALACLPMRCVGLTEAIGSTAALRNVVPAAREHLDWLLAQSPCDPLQAQRLARGPGASIDELIDNYSGDGVGVEKWMQRLLDGGR